MRKGDGSMSTTKDNVFDYEAYARRNSPESTRIQRGPDARRQRFEAAKTRRTIYIDGDILEQFRQLAPENQRYVTVINQALREWLFANDLKDLVREELQQMVQKALVSIQAASQLPKSKRETF